MFQPKQGRVERFNPFKKFGTIVVEESGQIERYFFYDTYILRGPVCPSAGMKVSFCVNLDEPIEPGRHPLAKQVTFDRSATVIAVLSGKLEAGNEGSTK